MVPVVEHVEMAEGHGHVLKDTLVPMELDLLLGALHAKERRETEPEPDPDPEPEPEPEP